MLGSKTINWDDWIGNTSSPPFGGTGSTGEIMVARSSGSKMCLLCRGGKMLCGKSQCPVVARAEALGKLRGLIDKEIIEGSTPPAVFVGRFGYPRVNIGPMIPPYYGDTEILDTPELWMGKSIEEVIDYRFSLVRGKSRSDVFEAQEPSRLLEALQELAMGEKPADTEAVFTRKPRRILVLSDDAQPFGPSAPMRSFITSNVSVDKRIEKSFYDRDMKASEAILSLYKAGVLVTRIQRSFSLGMFGVSSKRRLVPTRWGITAIDSTISSKLIEEVKQLPTIDEYLVYTFRNIGNIYAAILFPEKWSFEWIEAWFPKTFWNPSGSHPELMGDFEPYEGRTSYASVGGCYYSARLALAEKLSRERRQASGLLLREIHPEYILPVGVWNVRESIRELLRTKPAKFDTFQKAFCHALKALTITYRSWVASSTLTREAMSQRKLTRYFHQERLPRDVAESSWNVSKADFQL
jgi:hypothetical protein